MENEIIDLGIAKIKLKKIEEKKIILIGQCPFCERKIRATTQDQLDWNLSLHLKQKHSEDEDSKILIRQLERQIEAESKK